MQVNQKEENMTVTRPASGKLIIERKGPVTTVTLNRPEKHNALDREVSAELNAAVKEINVDRECRVVVFKGAGDTFCAGDDIKEFNDWTPQDGPWQVRLYQETVNIIENMYAITIAAVDGICTGGGLELTLVCDFVVATDRSRWGMPEINWDITPGWGGTSRLQKFAGRRKTKEWNLTGAMFDASTAERHNLINRLTTADRLNADVRQLVDVMLEKSVTTVRCTKHFLNAAAEASTQIGLAFEGAPPRQSLQDATGIREFVARDSRDNRRRLANALWQN
jgi:enoyl-CoA hydratase